MCILFASSTIYENITQFIACIIRESPADITVTTKWTDSFHFSFKITWILRVGCQNVFRLLEREKNLAKQKSLLLSYISFVLTQKSIGEKWIAHKTKPKEREKNSNACFDILWILRIRRWTNDQTHTKTKNFLRCIEIVLKWSWRRTSGKTHSFWKQRAPGCS